MRGGRERAFEARGPPPREVLEGRGDHERLSREGVWRGKRQRSSVKRSERSRERRSTDTKILVTFSAPDPHTFKREGSATAMYLGKTGWFQSCPINVSVNRLARRILFVGAPLAKHVLGRKQSHAGLFFHYPHFRVEDGIILYAFEPSASSSAGEKIQFSPWGKGIVHKACSCRQIS